MRSSVRSRLAPPSSRMRSRDHTRFASGYRAGCIDIVKEGIARPKGGFKGEFDRRHSLTKAVRGHRSGELFAPWRYLPRAWVLLITIKRRRAADGCLGAKRR